MRTSPSVPLFETILPMVFISLEASCASEGYVVGRSQKAAAGKCDHGGGRGGGGEVEGERERQREGEKVSNTRLGGGVSLRFTPQQPVVNGLGVPRRRTLGSTSMSRRVPNGLERALLPPTPRRALEPAGSGHRRARRSPMPADTAAGSCTVAIPSPLLPYPARTLSFLRPSPQRRLPPPTPFLPSPGGGAAGR